MAKVAIVMGSDSDMPIMKKAAEFLDQMGIDFEMTIISAHREPDTFFEYAKSAESRGMKSAAKAVRRPSPLVPTICSEGILMTPRSTTPATMESSRISSSI